MRRVNEILLLLQLLLLLLAHHHYSNNNNNNNILAAAQRDRMQSAHDTKYKNRPAVLPTKPSVRQQENIHLLVGGEGKELPRAREPVHSQIPTASHKKLPPPLLGKSTGHGIINPVGAAANAQLSPEKQQMSIGSVVTGGGSPAKKTSVRLTDISREVFE